MHTDYVEGKPGPLESQIGPDNLQIWLQLARDAIAGRKRMIVTHSEIFPGTFASTTETADYLVAHLNLRRRPVLKWGPMGTQNSVKQRRQISLDRFCRQLRARSRRPVALPSRDTLSGYIDRWLLISCDRASESACPPIRRNSTSQQPAREAAPIPRRRHERDHFAKRGQNRGDRPVEFLSSILPSRGSEPNDDLGIPAR